LEKATHAGGLVFRVSNGNLQFLIVTATDDNDTWVLPKGHIETDEIDEVAACREVQEEAGVSASVVDHLGDLEFVRNDESVYARMFLMGLLYESSAGGENRGVKWLFYKQALKHLTHEDACSPRFLPQARSKMTRVSFC